MHRRHFLAATLVLGTALASLHASAAETFSEQRPLRVMTYNIHHGEGVDGKLDLTRIAAIIASAQADLVALQEVDQKTTRTGGVDEAAEIARLAGLQFFYGKAMDYQGGAYGQALLSRWPLENAAVHALPNPAKVEPRIAVSATITPPGAKPFRFVTTHLDATKDDNGRWLQAQKLIELFGADATPTILAGDMNSRPETRAAQALLAAFTDASAASPAFTIPSKKPTGRIDYVLLHPAGSWTTRSSTVLPEAIASDHRPVLVELVPAAK